MNKKYWIIFLIAVNIILIAGVIVYFKIQGKRMFPEKVTVVKTEEPTPSVSGDTRRSVFIAHAMTPRESKYLGELFDKMSRGDNNAEIVFYNNVNGGYFHDDKRVYWHEQNSNSYDKVDCKKEEFKTLSKPNFLDIHIGICNKAVFVAGVKDYRADGESFDLLDADYYGDKKNTFYKTSYYDKVNGKYKISLVPVEGNPTEIKSLVSKFGMEYAEANGKLLFKNKMLSNIDLGSFNKVDGRYYADNKAYYFLDTIEGPLFIANKSSFAPLSFSNGTYDHYVRIGRDVYIKNIKLTSANVDRLKPFDAEINLAPKTKLVPCSERCSYVWDGRNIYYEGKRLSADYKTFRLIGYGAKESGSSHPVQPDYAIDKTRVYYHDKVVIGADVNTFKPISSGRYYLEYGKDKDNVYFEDKKINKADPRTFEILSSQPREGCPLGKYSKDANYVFHKWNIVKDADPNTFETFVTGNGDFGKDNNNYYHDENKAKEEDWTECQYG